MTTPLILGERTNLADQGRPRQPLTDEVRAFLTQQFKQEPAYTYIGLQLARLDTGLCSATLQYAPHLLHHRGAFQGGIVAMMADSVAGYAALTLEGDAAISRATDMATIEFKTSFFVPAVGASLRCDAEVTSAGRSIVFCTARSFIDDAGTQTLCAESTTTFKRLRA